MSMTLYNIYSFFIHYRLYRLYHNMLLYIISLWLKQSREINRTNYFDQIRCYHTCDNASMKLIMVWFVHSKFCKQKKTTSLLVKEMQIMSDSQFQYTSNQNQFQNN